MCEAYSAGSAPRRAAARPRAISSVRRPLARRVREAGAHAPRARRERLAHAGLHLADLRGRRLALGHAHRRDPQRDVADQRQAVHGRSRLVQRVEVLARRSASGSGAWARRRGRSPRAPDAGPGARETGAGEEPQWPISSLVTPCVTCPGESGNSGNVKSECEWRSMKPGATTRPPTSRTRSPAGRGQVAADLRDPVPVDGGRRPAAPGRRSRRTTVPPRSRSPERLIARGPLGGPMPVDGRQRLRTMPGAGPSPRRSACGTAVAASGR